MPQLARKERPIDKQQFLPLLLVLIVLALGLGGRPDLKAQGFNWQYSARMPSDYPTLFLGFSASGNLLDYAGLLAHDEKRRDIIRDEIVCQDCGRFDDGAGEALAFGLRAEHWYSESLAFNLGLRFERLSFSASEELPPQPHQEIGDILTELEFSAVNYYLLIDCYAKQRLFDSFFSVAGGLEAGLLLSESVREVQKITNPPEAFFDDGGQLLQEREVIGNLTAMAGLKLNAVFLIGIDLPLARGFYANPSLLLTVPLLDQARDAAWKASGLGLQINLLYGMP